MTFPLCAGAGVAGALRHGVAAPGAGHALNDVVKEANYLCHKNSL